jgi:hypothetical protein
MLFTYYSEKGKNEFVYLVQFPILTFDPSFQNNSRQRPFQMPPLE